MKDLHSDTSAAVLIAAAALDADNTPPAVDLQGFYGCEIVLAVGVGGITFTGTNKVEFVLTHSDDNSTYTNCDSDDVLGVTIASGGIIKSLTAAHASAAVYRFGYIGQKRYIKLLADFSGTHAAATPMAAVAMRGAVQDGPAADQA